METTRYADQMVFSDVLAPGEITARLGVVPDRTRAFGTPSPRTGRLPLSDTYSWELSETGDLTRWSQEMVDRLRERIRPAEAELRRLVGTGLCQAKLGIHLYPSSEQGENEVDLPDGHVGPGFGLDAEAVAWLASLRTAI